MQGVRPQLGRADLEPEFPRVFQVMFTVKCVRAGESPGFARGDGRLCAHPRGYRHLLPGRGRRGAARTAHALLLTGCWDGSDRINGNVL